MYIVQNVQEVVDYSISKNEDSLIVDISSSYGMSPAFLINGSIDITRFDYGSTFLHLAVKACFIAPRNTVQHEEEQRRSVQCSGLFGFVLRTI